MHLVTFKICSRYVKINAGIVFLSLLLNVGCKELHKADREAGFQESRIQIDKAFIRPDDGDTFYYKDITIRVLGMDTPEIIHKEHGIFEDQPYGREAAKMTWQILTEAKAIEPGIQPLPANNLKVRLDVCE